MFGNPVKAVIDYLRTTLALRSEPELAGLTIAAEVPTGRDPLTSTPLLVVRRVGGISDRYDVRDFPRLDFMVWHSTEFKATAVANIVRWVMLHIPAGTVFGTMPVYRVEEFAGPVKLPDPAGSSADVVMFTLSVPLRVTT